jgi:two-component system, OmpR family, sensor histidine kinase KdpD
LELILQGRVDKAPDRRPADIEEAFSQALHDVYPFITDKNLHVDVQMTLPEGTLLFASEQIQQVFVNLLENSCKFSPPNGDVQVHGYSFYHPAWAQNGAQSNSETRAQIPNAYRIDISDSGPGVPPNLAERIFEAYTSYSDFSDRSGAGLGLAICKAIIAAHGGAIWATPVPEGGRFSFLLPMDPSKRATSENHPEDAGIEFEQAGCR